MDKTITLYRYRIALGNLDCTTHKIVKETDKCYFCEDGRRFMKEDIDKADIKDRTNYPYVDYFSTKAVTRQQAVKKIKDFFTQRWGLS